MYLKTIGVGVVSHGEGGEVDPSTFIGSVVEERLYRNLGPETREIKVSRRLRCQGS